MNLTRGVASLLMTILLVTACGGGGGAHPASEIVFAAKAYPSDGPAECPVDADGRTLLNMRRITSVDAETVRFELCTPDPAFLSKLATVPFGINDSGYLASAGVDGSIAERPNGTGPWRLDTWQRGQQIVMSRFDDYWGEKAKVRQLVITWQPEGNARLLQVQSGAADGAASISSDDYAMAEADANLHLIEREPLSLNYYFFNNKIAPFSDVRVRQAIAYGINRKQITENFFPKGSEVARTFVPCTVKLACAGVDWYPQDPAMARTLLSEAGLPNGFQTTIYVRDRTTTETPEPQQMAVDLQAQLKTIGIDAKIEVLENTTWRAQARAGALPGIMIGGGWVPDFLDPSNYLDFVFLRNGGGSQRLGNTYPKIEEALLRADATVDEAERQAIYAEIEGLIKDSVPLIPNTYASSAALYRADVAGAYASAVQLERLASMTPGGRDKFVWLNETEPNTLYCADDPSGQPTYVACFQFMEGLYTVDPKTSLPIPSLAQKCTPSADQLTWTCTLQSGVRFHNGAAFDASDVVDSYAVMWDCAHPWRAGSTGTFFNWSFVSGYLHPEVCSSGN